MMMRIRGAEELRGDCLGCVVCYAGSLIVIVIFGFLLLIVDMEIAVKKKLFKRRSLVSKTK